MIRYNPNWRKLPINPSMWVFFLIFVNRKITLCDALESRLKERAGVQERLAGGEAGGGK